ncbi:MAG TPA: hypothetical protein ENK43_02105 [Planctomycetes bacterium]|nr:hypothetical protein [Planctomycetota bacterium]
MESGIEEVQPRGRNGLGIAGFVLSITCCLAIPGTILSLIALRRSPKIFAILGLIIGLPLASIQLTLAVKQDQTGYIFGEKAGQYIEGAWDSVMVNTQSATFRETHGGRYPQTVDELTDLEERYKTDPWGRPYGLELVRMKEKPELISLRLISKGPDGIADTADDVAWPPKDDEQFEPVPPEEIQKETKTKPEGK